ncbi:MAG: DUF6431 domain-containing protein [Streptosporangiaceae bacterium]
MCPRPDCPSCAGPMTLWSGYRRHVRAGGRCWRIFVPRMRCRPCAVSHVLLPAFVLVWRLDAAETIGTVITVVADDAGGVRPAAARAGVLIRRLRPETSPEQARRTKRSAGRSLDGRPQKTARVARRPARDRRRQENASYAAKASSEVAPVHGCDCGAAPMWPSAVRSGRWKEEALA